MTKIQPMTVEEIATMTRDWFAQSGYPPYNNNVQLRLILAWAHARAWAHRCADAHKRIPARQAWDESNYLNEVLSEIGWPEDQR